MLSATCDAEEIRMTSKMSRGLGLRTSVQVPAQLFISYVNFSKFSNLSFPVFSSVKCVQRHDNSVDVINK